MIPTHQLRVSTTYSFPILVEPLSVSHLGFLSLKQNLHQLAAAIKPTHQSPTTRYTPSPSDAHLTTIELASHCLLRQPWQPVCLPILRSSVLATQNYSLANLDPPPRELSIQTEKRIVNLHPANQPGVALFPTPPQNCQQLIDHQRQLCHC